jgi:signal transduction histidine kinase
MDEENKISHTYLSTPQGDSIAVLHLPLKGISLTENIAKRWREKRPYYEHWDKDDFNNWTEQLFEKGFISSIENYSAGLTIDNLDLHFLPFDHGMLYIGNVEPLSDKSLKLAQSLTNAFSVAYNRYEDFRKLEQAKNKVDDALVGLKAAQEQLVQQEKLASLGQLTAGIAHEIKNPLNFVNNFSELSIELIEEVRDEVNLLRQGFEGQGREMGGMPSDASAKDGERSFRQPAGRAEASADKKGYDEGTEFLLGILTDIEANLKTIHKHGTRADTIVKSMLEHSRGGTGEKENQNVNKLLKEFGNLSFHGMRAAKNPINVDMHYELDESIPEVPLIAEDFSRVIINLCNNAFDAMREKEMGDMRRETEEDYNPKLTIRTFHEEDVVAVEIEDNGPGIPEEMKDKILQPFFTTKKGTQGTGLGLSITNDIVKAHGGELSVTSQKGSGTTFIIKLPQMD